jgi:hypothetical protein
MDPYRPDQVRPRYEPDTVPDTSGPLSGQLSGHKCDDRKFKFWSVHQLAPLDFGSTPPPQATPLPNFFLAGSYTKQDYIDSMEGATLSGRQCAAEVSPKMLHLEFGWVYSSLTPFN